MLQRRIRVENIHFCLFTNTAGGRQMWFLSLVRNAWARLLGFGMRFFMLCVFVTPDDVVQSLSDEVQDYAERQQHGKEHNPQRQRQHVHHGVHPDAAFIIDYMYPEIVISYLFYAPDEQMKRLVSFFFASLYNEKNSHNISFLRKFM